MDAYISGQAAVAILVEGANTTLVRADAPEVRIPLLSPESLSYVFQDCNDVELLNGTNETDVHSRLHAAWGADIALRLILIILDPSEYVENRNEAASALEEIFDAEKERYIENNLYVKPIQMYRTLSLKNICAESHI